MVAIAVFGVCDDTWQAVEHKAPLCCRKPLDQFVIHGRKFLRVFQARHVFGKKMNRAGSRSIGVQILDRPHDPHDNKVLHG